MKTILVFGDSNTHGSLPLGGRSKRLRYAKGARWPDVMAAELGPDHDVIAEGLPGRTTVHDDRLEGGKRSGAEVLPALLPSHAPLDLLVLLLGTNDLKSQFSVAAHDIALSVKRLALMAREFDPDLDMLILSPLPVRETGPLAQMFRGAEARQEGLADHLADLAMEMGVGFLDLAQHGTVSDTDGIHWEEDTHSAIGKAVARAVRQRL